MDALTKPATTSSKISPAEMNRLIDIHLAAEMAGDSAAAVSVYTDDVEHDMVGAPHGPLHGPAAAQGFYDHLVRDIRTESMPLTRDYYGDDFCVQEHQWIGIPALSSTAPPLRSLCRSRRRVCSAASRSATTGRTAIWSTASRPMSASPGSRTTQPAVFRFGVRPRHPRFYRRLLS